MNAALAPRRESLSYYGVDLADEEDALTAEFGFASEATFFGCGLTRLATLRVEWSALRKLNVSSNDLTEDTLFKVFDTTNLLEQLDASSNRLKRFPRTIHLPRLRTLNVSFNEIDSLDGVAALAPRLEQLDVRSNRLSQVVSAFLPSSLTDIKVTGNPLAEKRSRPPLRQANRRENVRRRDDYTDDDDSEEEDPVEQRRPPPKPQKVKTPAKEQKMIAEVHAKAAQLEADVKELAESKARAIQDLTVKAEATKWRTQVAKHGAVVHVMTFVVSRKLMFRAWARWRRMAVERAWSLTGAIWDESQRASEAAFAAKHSELLDVKASLRKVQVEDIDVFKEDLVLLRKERDGYNDVAKRAKARLAEMEDEIATMASLVNKWEDRGAEIVAEHAKDREMELAQKEALKRAATEAAYSAGMAMGRSLALDEHSKEKTLLIEDHSKEKARLIEDQSKEKAQLVQELEAVRKANASARSQVAELRSAFERAAVASAEGRAAASTAKSQREQIGANLAELAKLARDQRDALAQVRHARDDARRRCAALEGELADIEALSRDRQRDDLAPQLRLNQEAADAATLAALAEARRNARLAAQATNAAEAARHEASRREACVTDLEHRLDDADRLLRDAQRDKRDALKAKDALLHDRQLLQADLDKADARLRAQFKLEQHLRTSITKLRANQTSARQQQGDVVVAGWTSPGATAAAKKNEHLRPPPPPPEHDRLDDDRMTATKPPRHPKTSQQDDEDNSLAVSEDDDDVVSEDDDRDYDVLCAVEEDLRGLRRLLDTTENPPEET